jgi:hypothetical protein
MWFAVTLNTTIAVNGGVITLNGSMRQVIESPGLAARTITLSVEDPSGAINIAVAGVAGVITAGAGRRGATLVVPAGSTANIQVTMTATNVAFKRVQLEAAPNATPFEERLIGLELVLCMRYWQQSFAYGVPYGNNKAGVIVDMKGYGTGAVVGQIPLAAPMRGAPSVGFYSSNAGGAASNNTFQGLIGGWINSSNPSVFQPTGTGFGYLATLSGATAGQAIYAQGNWVASAQLLS